MSIQVFVLLYGFFVGDCEKEEFAGMCNDKLIGVRSYDIITDSYNAAEFQADDWRLIRSRAIALWFLAEIPPAAEAHRS